MSAETFHAPSGRVPWLSTVVVDAVPSHEAAIAVLDLGCGAGEQLFDLARRLPEAHLTGIDISPRNVEVAERLRRADPAGSRLAFGVADIATFRAQPFDVVLTYSVLQLVPGETADLARGLAALVRPGGVFVNAMPTRGTYNVVLATMRRGLRAIRSRWVDALLLRMARLLHGDAVGGAPVAERIPYAYIVPERYEQDVADALKPHGFQTIRREAVAHASPAQLVHTLRVMRRDTVVRR